MSTRGEQTMFSLDYDDDRIVAVFVFSAAHSPLAVSDARVDPAVTGADVGFVGPFETSLKTVPDLDTTVDSLELEQGQLAAVVAAIPAPACDPIEFSRADIRFDMAAPDGAARTTESVSEAPIVRTEIGDKQSWFDALTVRYCDQAGSTDG